ncbi:MULTISPECIES: hypothetical protein [Pirellulaceae]|nr:MULTISPECIES: hypothetical protein [Pirellulaceae]
MNDRPIWRPNCFSIEQWEQLSREEQIDWWNASQQTLDGTRSPNHAADLYARGVITKNEVFLYVFERITVENVKSFLVTCPQEILNWVMDGANRLPSDGDDKGWDEFGLTSGRTYAPWLSDAEVRSAEEEHRKQLREGVRIFRAVMKSIGP